MKGQGKVIDWQGGNFADLAAVSTQEPEGVPANLPVTVAELKKKLIELCRTRNKPYGIIVRKMDFPSGAAMDEVRRLMSGQQGGRPVSPPILVYKVYVDGHEELVRGMRFRGFSVRSLKDILAAGDDSAAFEYMENGLPFALIGGGGFTAAPADADGVHRRAFLTARYDAESADYRGVTHLAQVMHVRSLSEDTVLSQVGRAVYGNSSILYFALQIATMAILIFAANTSFASAT